MKSLEYLSLQQIGLGEVLAINVGLKISSELTLYAVASSVKMERRGSMDAPMPSILLPPIN
jgi:hypothetical protein